FRHRQTAKRSAVVEGFLADPLHIIRQREVEEISAISKRVVADAPKALSEADIGQARTIRKSSTFDVCDAVGKRDAGQVGALEERRGTDAGDWQAIERARDGHGAARSDVAGDGDGAVIGHISELRLERSERKRTDAINAAGISRPLRVAEVKPATVWNAQRV